MESSLSLLTPINLKEAFTAFFLQKALP